MNDRTEHPVKRHRGSALDARLQLLDRQLVDDNDDPIGIVDDLELTGVELDRDIPKGSEAPQVTALLSGQVLATRIFGGAPPRAHLQEIPWRLVQSVGITVKLKPNDMRFDVGWVERWLRDRIVKHIPGGRHAGE
ncbi:PRC-barrel domain-containing protein [Mycolicibacterium pulveris]|uniref:PRC-barrel domain-containing protein n=1 Tax=Mycolicibacterium pulveris TaxID=36813 RepID=UPI003CE9F07C